MAIIHTTISSNDYAVLEGLLVEEGETGFDRARMGVLFRGTEAQLRAAFPKGSSPNYPGTVASGGKMVCAGVRVQKARFGFLWAAVEWLGLITPPAGLDAGGGKLLLLGGVSSLAVRSVTNEGSTTELMLPQSVAGGGTVVAEAPYNSSGNYARTRSRVIGEAWGSTYTGVLIVARGTPPAMPRIVGRLRPTGLSSVFNNARSSGAGVPESEISAGALSQSNWAAGMTLTNTNGGGWVVRNFQPVQTRVLGDWLLIEWRANAEWIDRHSVS